LFCSNCGRKIDSTAEFCTLCGKPVKQPQSPPQAAAYQTPPPPMPPSQPIVQPQPSQAAHQAPPPPPPPSQPSQPIVQPPQQQAAAYQKPSLSVQYQAQYPVQPAYPAKTQNRKQRLAIIISAGVVAVILVSVGLFLIFGSGEKSDTGGGRLESPQSTGESPQSKTESPQSIGEKIPLPEDTAQVLSQSKIVGSWSLSGCAFSFEDTGVGGFEGSFSVNEDGLTMSTNLFRFDSSGGFNSGFKLVNPEIYAGESLDFTQYNRWRLIEDATPASGSILSGELEFEPSVEGFGYTASLSEDEKLTLTITELFVAESITTKEGFITVGGEVPMTYTMTLVPTPETTTGAITETRHESKVFPIDYETGDYSFSYTGYGIGTNESGQTTVALYGTGQVGVGVRDWGVMPSCEIEAGGEAYRWINIDVKGDFLLYTFDTSLTPERITLTNSTGDVDISFDVADEPQS